MRLAALKHSVCEIDNLCLLNHPIEAFNKCFMRWIFLYIVVSVLCAGKFNDKSMRDTILGIVDQFNHSEMAECYQFHLWDLA